MDLESSTSKREKVKEFDMGSGTVWSVFRKIWIPAIISAVIAGTFTVFDTLFISLGYHQGAVGGEMMVWDGSGGHSQYGVAAMSFATPYTFLIIGVGVMIGAGIAQRLASAKAEGNTEKAQRIMNSYLPSIFLAGLIVGISIFFLAKPLVWMGSGFQPYLMENWTNVPVHVTDAAQLAIGQQFSQAAWYLRIQGLGAIPYMVMVSGALILRVTGNASKATIYAFFALLVNIVFDALFVCVLGMNLVGAAIASVMAQSTAMVCYIRYFKNKGEIRITQRDWKEAKNKFWSNAKLGNTAFILQSVITVMLLSTTMSLGFVFYNQADIITLYQASFQGYYALFSFANMVLVGTALTMQPIVVYNNAKGFKDRVETTKRLSFGLSMGIGCLYAALIIFYPPIVKIFVSVQPGFEWTLTYAMRIVQMLFLAYIPLSYTTMAGNYLQALGKYRISSIIVYLKPIILFPIMLILGFATINVPGTWTGGLYNLEINPTTGKYAPLGIFWGFLIAEIPGFVISIFGMRQLNNEMNTKRQLKDISVLEQKANKDTLPKNNNDLNIKKSSIKKFTLLKKRHYSLY